MAFCRAVDMSPQFLTQLESGKKQVPPRYAVAIEVATKGKVKARDLRPDLPWLARIKL